jgi:glyoxylase-like metal-dependent hydrolase (beta-lactamase superfamily II)
MVRIELDLAPGVHRIEHAYTNCYVITDEEGVTLVDAGFPSTGRAVIDCLAAIGRAPSEIRALLLTHGHFDHVGFARGLHASLGVPVWVHPDDQRLAAHPYRYTPQQNRFAFPLRHPGSWPILSAMTAAGALTVRGVQADRTYADGEVLDVPGRPRAVHTPGHTWGQSVFHLADRDVLISGDALVTLDPYNGERGPRLVAPAATADTKKAYAALDRIEDLAADLVLPGHGDPWTEGTRSAVSEARRNSKA